MMTTKGMELKDADLMMVYGGDTTEAGYDNGEKPIHPVGSYVEVFTDYFGWFTKTKQIKDAILTDCWDGTKIWVYYFTDGTSKDINSIEKKSN